MDTPRKKPTQIKNMTPAEYSHQNYLKRRAKLIEDFGGKCKVCGTTDDLSVCKKIDVDVPEFETGNLFSMKREKYLAFLPYCDLLCKEHKVTTMRREPTLTHGTWWSSYRKKCQCEECLAYKDAFNLQRRTKRAEASGAKVKKARIKKTSKSLSKKKTPLLWRDHNPHS